MADSCCICGVVLATQDSDSPPWCKDIRGICRFKDQHVLSDQGSNDDDAIPFNLRIPAHGFKRFCCRRTDNPGEIDTAGDFCYPFHTACWTILQGTSDGETTDNNIETLFNVFESLHYDKPSRSLRWGHDYYFEDILDKEDRQVCQENIIASHEAVSARLADPLQFDFKEEEVRARLQKRRSSPCSLPPSTVIGDRPSQLSLLPPEIFESILCYLCFRDAQSVIGTCRAFYDRFGGSALDIRHFFWESMFWGRGETAFARSLRPEEGYSWKHWFFIIKSEAKDGPNRMSLQNRKRIWKLCADLIAIVRTIEEPRRARYGSVTSRCDRVPGPVVNCLALGSSTDGCRELAEIYVPFSASQSSPVRAVVPHYIVISNRKLISGLTFIFDNGRSVNAGYIGRSVNQADSIPSPTSLWLGFSRFGLEEVELDTYPRSRHNHDPNCQLAVARWPLGHVKGIWLGLDAMRIVRISLDTTEHPGFDTISWTHPYPEIPPSIYESDIATLHKVQRESFAPVSTLCIAPANGQLIGIKVYSALGSSAGVTGIGFLYDGVEDTLGSANNASLAFFLDGERLVNVTAYRSGSLICHLEFTTTSHRTSGRLPQWQDNSPASLEYINYAASKNGYITGLCGCFADERLNCLGVITTTTALISQPHWSAPHNPAVVSHLESRLQEMPLGGIKNHGEHRTCVQLNKKYRSVQVSLNPVTSTKHRRAGQVTGLLFRSGDGRSDLLGQWTGAGDTCVLGENEQILALEFTTRKPRLAARPGLSQVEGITLVTNLKRVNWGLSRPQELAGKGHSQQRMVEIRWDFNAIFDRHRCMWS